MKVAVIIMGLGVLWLSANAFQRQWEPQRLIASLAGSRSEAKDTATAMISLISSARAQPPIRRLDEINDFTNNKIVYKDDSEVWGVVDYWASPGELLQKGAGDCEDFAISKYFALVAAGIPHRALRLVYVKALIDGRPQAHMVLAYYHDLQSPPLISDNLVPALMPATSRSDLSPVFSFNAESIWEGTSEVLVTGRAIERLRPWSQAVKKARQEGF